MREFWIDNKTRIERRLPQPGEIWQHFKGYTYEIIAIAKHTEDGDELVIYKRQDEPAVYARPLDMFMSRVDNKKYPNAKQHWRFKNIAFPIKSDSKDKKTISNLSSGKATKEPDIHCWMTAKLDEEGRWHTVMADEYGHPSDIELYFVTNHDGKSSVLSKPFTNQARLAVYKLLKDRNDFVYYDDIFITWFCKTLQNWKALIGIHGRGEYYEVTHNGDKGETYVDEYKLIM